MALPDPLTLSDLTKSRLVEITIEFHHLQKLDLFDRQELCEIMENLINLQAKINGDDRCVSYCVDYIEYQLQLLKKIQLRALEKPGLKKDAAEWCIINKIKVAYQEAIKEFTDDSSLHIPYIKFCIKIDAKDDVVEWALYFLRNDITNKTIWNILKDLYFKETDDIKSVVWSIMPIFSAQFVTEIINQEETQSEGGGTCLKKLGDLFNMAFTYIRCSYFHISLLDNIKDPDIMKQILRDFRQNVFMWNALAQMIWRVDIKSEPGAGTFRSPKTRLEQCVAKYKEGIACLLPENKSGLWCTLINFLFFVYEDPDNAISNSFKLNIIMTHLTEGMPYFSENQFLKWLKLEDNPTECLHISEKAVAILPNSVKLWSERLKYEFLKDDTSNAPSLFYVAVNHLKEKSLPLWKDMIQYTVLTSGPDSLMKLYWEGSEYRHEVSSKIRPMFLEWLALHKGIKETRAVYTILVEKEPHSKEMHATMSKLENILAEDFDEECAEKVHKIACLRFSDDIEVRLNYMKFLLSLNSRGVANLNERVRVALNESLTALPSHLHQEFKLKYSEVLKASTF